MFRRGDFGLHKLKACDQVRDTDDERLPRPMHNAARSFAELFGPALQLKPRQELPALFG